MEKCSSTSRDAGHGQPAPRPRQALYRRVVAWLGRQRMAYRQHRKIDRLASRVQCLDDRLLRDMGLERGNIHDWARMACAEPQGTSTCPEQGA